LKLQKQLTSGKLILNLYQTEHDEYFCKLAHMSIADAASSLGTVTDIWVLIILIIPGFLTFKILLWLAAYELKIDQFTSTIYSLICSLIVFIPIAYIFDIESLNEIGSIVIDSRVIAFIIALAILFGAIPGVLIRITFRRKFKFRSPWDGLGDDYLGKAIIIYAADNREYIGWIKRISRGKDEKKEISLGNPRLVRRLNGKSELVPLGDELLFTEGSIRTILRRKP
jgi:hypothetical protein